MVSSQAHELRICRCEGARIFGFLHHIDGFDQSDLLGRVGDRLADVRPKIAEDIAMNDRVRAFVGGVVVVTAVCAVEIHCGHALGRLCFFGGEAQSFAGDAFRFDCQRPIQSLVPNPV